MDEPRDPVDYRFLLANERTYLAYVRTALSLQVAGLGVLQFLTQAHEGVRGLLGLTLVAAGSFVAVTGYRRFHRNDATIRAGDDMTTPRGGIVLAAAVSVVPLAGAVLVAAVAR